LIAQTDYSNVKFFEEILGLTRVRPYTDGLDPATEPLSEAKPAQTVACDQD